MDKGKNGGKEVPRPPHGATSDWINTSVSTKSSPFYFCDNLPRCKQFRIIFGTSTADKIWNKLTHGDFDIYLLYVISICRKKGHTVFSQFRNVEILMPHFRQFLR